MKPLSTLLLGLLVALGPARKAQANCCGQDDGILVVLATGGSLLPSSLSVAGQFMRDEEGRVDQGWAAVQVLSGLVHVGGGSGLIAASANNGSVDNAAGHAGFVLLGLGLLWGSLGVYNLLQHHDARSKSTSLVPVVTSGLGGGTVLGVAWSN
ncbi:MAG: hypothetical protein AAFU79_34535 [Myxococcota bacterium]